MKILKIGLLTALLSGCSSQPKNFAECVLDNMPGIGNQIARDQVHSYCKSNFPDMYYTTKKGYESGLFAKYSDKAKCTIEKSKNTLNSNAVINIKKACNFLYEKPQFKNEMCAYDQPNYSELVLVK